MRALSVFIFILSISTGYASTSPSQGKLTCSAALPIIFAPKSTVVLLPSSSDEGLRSITFKKNTKSKIESHQADCSTQASILTCMWKTGKIKIDTTSILHDDGIAIGGSRVGAYDYFNAKTIIKRAVLNKIESVRCRTSR